MRLEHAARGSHSSRPPDYVFPAIDVRINPNYRPNQMGGQNQLKLPIPSTWGGRREGAGRKPRPGRRCVPRRRRPDHNRRHPVHVTLRACGAIRCLRAPHVFPAVRSSLAAASSETFRVIEFSVQQDHVHLIVEADDRLELTRGMRGLAIRIALGVNRVLGRKGRLWGDRYHSRALKTPREVRRCMVYVLQNFRKHVRNANDLDPCSSAPWFAGWSSGSTAPARQATATPPVRAARTWLAGIGWKVHGLISPDECPGHPDKGVQGSCGWHRAAERKRSPPRLET